MKRPLLALLWVSLLVIAVGCGTTKTPARIAYTTLDSIGEAADKAGPAWGQWLSIQKAKADQLLKSANEEDRGKGLELQSDLLKAEGKVSAAFYKYQAAFQAAVKIGAETAAEGDSYQKAVQAASTALSEMLGLIAQFQTTP